MRKPLISAILLLGLALTGVEAGADTRSMTMGDGTVRGELLQDYEFTWLQCSKQDDQWVDGGTITESLVWLSDEIRLVQRAGQPQGVSSESTTFFDRGSLAPLRMEQQATAPDGTVLATASRVLSADGYRGEATRSDETSELGGKITSNMWHGGALGLPLVTIEPSHYPVEFASSMIAFDGTYRTIASVAGRESLQHDGSTVDALLVDVEWHHIESGDIYPPGPDASGGRYWLVADPPDGFPYVPQYRTDTYLVTTLLSDCSKIDATPE